MNTRLKEEINAKRAAAQRNGNKKSLVGGPAQHCPSSRAATAQRRLTGGASAYSQTILVFQFFQGMP